MFCSDIEKNSVPFLNVWTHRTNGFEVLFIGSPLFTSLFTNFDHFVLLSFKRGLACTFTKLILYNFLVIPHFSCHVYFKLWTSFSSQHFVKTHQLLRLRQNNYLQKFTIQGSAVLHESIDRKTLFSHKTLFFLDEKRETSNKTDLFSALM